MRTIRSAPGPNGVTWWSPASDSISRPASVASRTSSAGAPETEQVDARLRRAPRCPRATASYRVVSVTVAAAASCRALDSLVTRSPVSGSSRTQSRMMRDRRRRPGPRRRAARHPRWRRPPAAGGRQHPHRLPLGVRSVEQQQAIEGDEREAVAGFQREGREVGLDELQLGGPRRGPGRPAAHASPARRSIAGSLSTAVTRYPARASGTASRPLPAASSRIGPPVRSAIARYRSRSPGSSSRSRS